MAGDEENPALLEELGRAYLYADQPAKGAECYRKAMERDPARSRLALDLGRYYRLATELAFDKRRLTNFPAERDTQARVVQLRNQVAVLGNKL